MTTTAGQMPDSREKEMSDTMLNLQEMEVNFGPQHPSTHGVLRVILKIDGERIVDAKPIIGYLHRGTEKLFENMTYPTCVPHTDRMDYVAAATNKPSTVSLGSGVDPRMNWASAVRRGPGNRRLRRSIPMRA